MRDTGRHLIRAIGYALLLLIGSAVLGARETIRFNRISIDVGLSQSTVLAILQDNNGYMWFGTQDGLNRFDGYEFQIFRHDAKRPNSLSDNFIWSLFQDKDGVFWIGTDSGGLNRFLPAERQFEAFANTDDPNSLSHNRVFSIVQDHDGTLWVGTENGLNRFQPETGSFKRYLHDPNNPDSLSHNHVKNLMVDKQGRLWIGTDGGGLNRLIPGTDKFVHFTNDPLNPKSLSDNRINHLYQDRSGSIWISTWWNGLSKYDGSNNFTHYAHDADNKKSISNWRVWGVVEDTNGYFWVGTSGGGLNRFDPSTGVFDHYLNEPENEMSISSNHVISVYQDRGGGLWFGTFNGGVNRFDAAFNRFMTYKHESGNHESLSEGRIFAILEDHQKHVWVGAYDTGLNRFDRKTGVFEHMTPIPGDPTSLGHHSVRSLFQDSKNRLWVGTWGSGLNLYLPKTDNFKHYTHDPQNPQSLSHDRVTDIYEDLRGNLWIGTERGGLNGFDPDTDTFTQYQHNPTLPASLAAPRVTVMLESSNGFFWVGTYDGLDRMDRGRGQFEHIRHNPKDPNSLSQNRVISLHQSLNNPNHLWIGTYRGLNRMDMSKGAIQNYGINDGLPNDAVLGIQEDNQARLWISTNKGLTVMDTANDNFKTYDAKDGIQSDEFTVGASFQSAAGEMFFGGTEGVTMFYPAEIKDNSYIPPIVVTDFLLANQSVPLKSEQPDSPLIKAIEETRQLTLNHKQIMFSFEFAALHYTRPMKNRYAYKMEGLDKQWITTDASNRRATYTTLKPGSYTFRVKGGNNDGVWNENGISVDVKVLPPPWLTWWAKSGYALVIVLIILWYMSLQRDKLMRQKQVIELERKSAERLRQMDKLKDEFLANTSFQLKTPISEIIGLTEGLIDGARGELTPEAGADLGLVVAGGRRLTSLINDILDMSVLRNQDLDLNIRAIDFYALTEVVLTLSRPLVTGREIRLINGVSPNANPVSADEDRLMQIMHNIIGNAIKYTETGFVKVTAQQRSRFLSISITDTGIGIPDDMQERIFTSFEELESQDTVHFAGTGLGLALTKRLVQLHGGDITVQSKQGVGSTFTFSLPISDHEPSIDLDADETMTITAEPADPHSLEDTQTILIDFKAAVENAFRVLIVDDEAINRRVLLNYLSLQNYNVTEVTNGQDALDLIGRESFDLVLLDIMMPGMSGFTVCETLRKEYSVNDLPIIFLTAQNQVGDVESAFAAGGNDFLTKPVSKEELLARVRLHLRLLDINRNLEQKVNNRTAELNDKNSELDHKNRQLDSRNQEMEALDGIVKTVNSEIHPQRVFESLLNQGPLFLPETRIGFLWLAGKDDHFKLTACTVPERAANAPEASRKELHSRYLSQAKQLDDCLYLIENPVESSEENLNMVVLTLTQEDQIQGVLAWDTTTRQTLDTETIRKLARFRYHATSALAKAQFLLALEEKNAEIIKTQNTLVLQEKMATLGTLTAGVAHEFSNPNNYIVTSVANLEREHQRFKQWLLELAGDDADEEIAGAFDEWFNKLFKQIATIKDGCDRIRSIVEDLRLFSRMDESTRKRADIQAGLAATLGLVRSQYKHDVTFETQFGDPLYMECWPAELNQVYLNLILNACQSIVERRRNEGPDAPGVVTIAVAKKNNRAQISFKDTGCGIPEENQEKIFEAFFTTRTVGEGRGLGLYTAYKTVEKHGGRITVISKPNQGAAFTLNLPIR